MLYFTNILILVVWFLLPSVARLIIHSPIFFFIVTATTEIYTLSLHDALPIFPARRLSITSRISDPPYAPAIPGRKDRKSTRLNSSHQIISYAVFCLKKKIEAEGRKSNNSHTDY